MANFNISEILSHFNPRTKLIALVVLVTATVCMGIAIPIAKYYFASDRHNCTHCLEENLKLQMHIIELSSLFRQYTYAEGVDVDLVPLHRNRMTITPDSVTVEALPPPPVDRKAELREEINRVIEEAGKENN